MASLESLSKQVEELCKQQDKAIHDTMNELGFAIAELIEMMDRSATEQRAVSAAIIEGLKTLTNKPMDVRVDVQQPEPAVPVGYVLTVTDRGVDGSIRKVKLVPEGEFASPVGTPRF